MSVNRGFPRISVKFPVVFSKTTEVHLDQWERKHRDFKRRVYRENRRRVTLRTNKRPKRGLLNYSVNFYPRYKISGIIGV